MMTLLPCPFCGSKNVDPEGWASTERKGPACDACGASAETVERWNTRPGVEQLRANLLIAENAVRAWHRAALAMRDMSIKGRRSADIDDFYIKAALSLPTYGDGPLDHD